MPNPSGYNAFNRFAQQLAYGQVSQADKLKQAYPIPGLPDAAKNAQRRAVKGGPQGAPPTPMAPPAPPAQISPQFAAAQAWQEIAAIPGASDLVKAYAAKAAQGG